MIKRRILSLGINLHDYLGTWHIYDVKKAHRVKAHGESSMQLSGSYCMPIGQNIFYIRTVSIQVKGAKKILHLKASISLHDSNRSMRHAFALSLVL